VLPLIRFKEMLEVHRDQMNEDFNELIGAAEIVGARPNYLTVDEHGFYHVQASGTLDQVLYALEKQTEKLNRIKAQKER
jgi:hypothetical protein